MEEINLVKVFEKCCLDKKYSKTMMLIEPMGRGMGMGYYAECIDIMNKPLLLHPNGTIPSGGRITFMQTSQEISLEEYKRLALLHKQNFYSSKLETEKVLKEEGLID